MEDVKIRRVMLFCLVLMFMISLGFSAASATDSNDFSNLELDEGILSDSIGSNFDDDLVLSDSIDESNDLSNVESDSLDSNCDGLNSNLQESNDPNSNVLRDESNAIYVSPNGNDENDGLFNC